MHKTIDSNNYFTNEVWSQDKKSRGGHYQCCTHARREKREKIVVFQAKRDFSIGIATRGQNVTIFDKKGPFWILFRGVKGSFFKCILKQIMFRGIIVCNNRMKFSLGFFFSFFLSFFFTGKGKSRSGLCFENHRSRMCIEFEGPR